MLLTDEGMILRKRGGEILTLVQKAKSEVQMTDASIAGDVYIGAGETDIIRYFARAAKRMKKSCRHSLSHFQWKCAVCDGAAG